MTTRGIGLPPEVLADIYRGNYLRLVAGVPRDIDRGLVREELDRVSRIAASGAFLENVRRQVSELRDRL